MEFCPFCRRMVAVRRKVVDVGEENERHVQTVCASCRQVIFEAVRPLDEEPEPAEKRPQPDLGTPIKHRHRRPRPKRGT
jgi:hypothetical protein